MGVFLYENTKSNMGEYVSFGNNVSNRTELKLKLSVTHFARTANSFPKRQKDRMEE